MEGWSDDCWESAIQVWVVQQAIYAREKEMGLYRRRTQAGIAIDDRRKQRQSRWTCHEHEQSKCISMGGGSSQKRGFAIQISPNTNCSDFEMDEIYWFIAARRGHEMGVNTYLITLVSREPRQILAFAVARSVNSKSIQTNINNAPVAQRYWVDGCSVYKDVDYMGGLLKQNFEDKSDTHIVEGTNADIRQYIAGFQRKSRCFFRKDETMIAVLWVFINAYNEFGNYKMNYFAKNPFADRDLGFNHTRFI